MTVLKTATSETPKCSRSAKEAESSSLRAGAESGVDTQDRVGSLIRGLADRFEYADDAGMVDDDANAASLRVSRLCAGALEMADMEISVPKTKCMHVKRSAVLSPVREVEMAQVLEKGLLKHKCKHCMQFASDSRAGLRIHVSTCGARQRGVFEEEYVVESILDTRGSSCHRFYEVLWQGYDESETTWEPVRHLDRQQKLIRKFWRDHPELDEYEGVPDAVGEHRCKWCCKFCDSEDKLTTHCKSCCEKPRPWVGTRAEHVAKRWKLQRAQEREGKVHMEGKVLENVLNFQYLGVGLQADGDMRHAIELRMGMASARFGEMWCVWKDPSLSMAVKVQLFVAAVVSLFMYGCEAWSLTERNIRTVRGWCSRCMVKITGRTHREECRYPLVDLIGMIRRARMKYVGHMLRKGHHNLARRVLLIKAQNELTDGRSCTSVLMDVPNFESIEELIEFAEDKEGWGLLANALQRETVTVTDVAPLDSSFTSNNTSSNNTAMYKATNGGAPKHTYNLRSRNKCT